MASINFAACILFLLWEHIAMVLEGGFDEEGNFVFIPFDNLDKMSEYFRRMIIKFFLDKKLINERFARNLLTWRHSGFSINNEIRIYGWDEKARENLSQYIARPPISLKKVFYEPFHSKVLFKTKYNDYFKENVKMFDAQDFIADLTLHIPPKNVQYIRRYGLYASRTRGIWTSMPEVIACAPEGWKNEHLDDVNIKDLRSSCFCLS